MSPLEVGYTFSAILIIIVLIILLTIMIMLKKRGNILGWKPGGGSKEL